MRMIVSRMNPEEITTEFLEELKADKEEPSSMGIFKQCLQKYATHTKAENVNEIFVIFKTKGGKNK